MEANHKFTKVLKRAITFHLLHSMFFNRLYVMNVQRLRERQKRTLSHILVLHLSVVIESRPLKLFTTYYSAIQRQIVTFRLKQINKSYCRYIFQV